MSLAKYLAPFSIRRKGNGLKFLFVIVLLQKMGPGVSIGLFRIELGEFRKACSPQTLLQRCSHTFETLLDLSR